MAWALWPGKSLAFVMDVKKKRESSKFLLKIPPNEKEKYARDLLFIY